MFGLKRTTTIEPPDRATLLEELADQRAALEAESAEHAQRIADAHQRVESCQLRLDEARDQLLAANVARGRAAQTRQRTIDQLERAIAAQADPAIEKAIAEVGRQYCELQRTDPPMVSVRSHDIDGAHEEIVAKDGWAEETSRRLAGLISASRQLMSLRLSPLAGEALRERIATILENVS